MDHPLLDFLTMIFSDRNGIIMCDRLSGEYVNGRRQLVRPESFAWPVDAEKLVAWFEEHKDEDLYFSPMLYKVPQRTKNHVLYTPVVWCEADTAHPDNFKLTPTAYCETSPGKYHCYWLVDEPIAATWAESMSKKITYSHVGEGADKGGWALGKLLRLPGAANTKPEYEHYGKDYWRVVPYINGVVYSAQDFIDAYGEPEESILLVGSEDKLPDDLPPVQDVLDRTISNPVVERLYLREIPEDVTSWSEMLWRLEMELFREGLTAPEVFVIARGAKCNKYARDNRPELDLWKEVKRAEAEYARDGELVFTTTSDDGEADGTPMVPALELLSDDERALLRRNFVDEYIEWAVTKTDADPSYHEASALVILSLVLGDFGFAQLRHTPRLPLNIWALIIGVSTRTYKTTSKNLMMNLLKPLETDNYQYFIGSDTTPEALAEIVSEHPTRSLMYQRDEVQQLFQATGRSTQTKNYMNGFQPLLTELYDGRYGGRARTTGTAKRVEACDTCLTIHMSGVPGKIGNALSIDDFESGFLARFLFFFGKPSPPVEDDPDSLIPFINDDDDFTVVDDPSGVGNVMNAYVKSFGDIRLTDLQQQVLKARAFWANKIKGDPRPIGGTRAAAKRYVAFIKQVEEVRTELDESDVTTEVIKASLKRAENTVIKVAALLAMMEHRSNYDLPDILRAISMFERWYPNLIAMTRLVRLSEYSAGVNRFIAYIKLRGPDHPVSKQQLRKHFNEYDTRTYNDYLQGAMDQGAVKVKTIDGKAYYIVTEY